MDREDMAVPRVIFDREVTRYQETIQRQEALIKKLSEEISDLKSGNVSTRRSILPAQETFNGRSNRVARPTGGY